MKQSLQLLLGLLVAIPTSALSTASVTVDTPLQSTTSVRIATLIAGKPEKGVIVEFYRYSSGGSRDNEPCLTLASDNDGWIMVRRLAPARYDVIATAHKNLVAAELLDVEAKNGDAPTAFSMDLRPSVFPTWEELLERAENQAVTISLKTFSGVINDISGAAVPGAFVRIVRKGTNHKDQVVAVKSGLHGQFSADIADGVYIAIVSASGFQTQLIPFEITKDGSGELAISLTPAMST